jgi:hypothetical protein
VSRHTSRSIRRVDAWKPVGSCCSASVTIDIRPLEPAGRATGTRDRS